MANEQRTLSISRKFSLKDVSEGWDDCYVLYRPCTPRELFAVKNTELSLNDQEASIKHIIDFLSNHFVAGQVLLTNPDGKQTLGAMQRSDLDRLPDQVMSDLYLDVIGVSLDPKDTLTAPQASSEPSTNEATTKTSSSTESPETSPATS